MQYDLFTHVANAYGQSPEGKLDNESLYRTVTTAAGIPEDKLAERIPIGKDQTPRSPLTRKIRWYQQTLKTLGLIEHVPGERGIWQLTEEGRHKLHKVKPRVALVAFSTDLGVALWSTCEHVFGQLDTPITLCLTSPPYPLRRARNYGNPFEAEYVDFICRALEPIAKNLVQGGSVVLNISNDIFMPGSPARSLYRERLVIALCERLGLHKMDETIWMVPNKAPAPIQWASKHRYQLNTAYEPIYWFSNDPLRVRSDNRRVLEPHTERHKRLMARGGETRDVTFADGAYRIRPGDFGTVTSGRIPRNVLVRSHNCPDKNKTRKVVQANGLPAHSATMPVSVARFYIEFLTEPGDLVVDQYGGWFTTAKAAEICGRRWLATECMLEYVRGAAERFRTAPGFWLNQAFD